MLYSRGKRTISMRALFFSFSCLLLWISPSSASLPPRDLLGIASQDEGYYKGSVIKCRDGSGKFTRDQLNDEFCDCADGTDEPGTSACPEGKFYCRNAGHSPHTIFSSQVNDGICDCCDGSDEYDGMVDCKNTCWEAGKAAREKLKKKIETYQSGVVIRNQEVEKAKQVFAKEEAELTKLKSEEKMLKGLVDKLREQKERIEKAEEEERLKKEKEEKKLKEAAEKQAVEEQKAPEASQHIETPASGNMQEDGSKEAANAHETEEHGTDHCAETGTPADQHIDQVAEDQDGHGRSGQEDYVLENTASSTDLPKEHDSESQDEDILKAGTGDDSLEPAKEQDHGSVDTEGLSKEELGRLVASRWTGEKINEGKDANKGHEYEQDIPQGAEEEHEDELDIPEPAEEGNYYGYHSDVEDDRHKFEDEEFEDGSDDEYVDDHEESMDSYKTDEDQKSDDHSDLTSSSRPSWLDKIQQTVQNVFQAFNFFKTPVDISEASRVRKEYDDASSKLSKIQSRISSLTEKLKHDFGKDKEFYSFYDHCFESKLGKYVYKVCPFNRATQVEGHSSTQLGRWEKFEESYRLMIFSSGDRCWNGPDRTLKVRLRCGLKNELNDVDEPSRCEYMAVLSTPAICQEEKLRELQQKLENMTTSQPSHDEL